jgi:hypothetical protein
VAAHPNSIPLSNLSKLELLSIKKKIPLPKIFLNFRFFVAKDVKISSVKTQKPQSGVYKMWSWISSARDPTAKFDYEINEPIQKNDHHSSIFQIHKGKRKNSNEEVSIFVYDIKNGSDVKLELAKSFLKRLKTLRHPSVLQFLDSAENEKSLLIATEA